MDRTIQFGSSLTVSWSIMSGWLVSLEWSKWVSLALDSTMFWFDWKWITICPDLDPSALNWCGLRRRDSMTWCTSGELLFPSRSLVLLFFPKRSRVWGLAYGIGPSLLLVPLNSKILRCCRKSKLWTSSKKLEGFSLWRSIRIKFYTINWRRSICKRRCIGSKDPIFSSLKRWMKTPNSSMLLPTGVRIIILFFSWIRMGSLLWTLVKLGECSLPTSSSSLGKSILLD